MNKQDKENERRKTGKSRQGGVINQRKVQDSIGYFHVILNQLACMW